MALHWTDLHLLQDCMHEHSVPSSSHQLYNARVMMLTSTNETVKTVRAVTHQDLSLTLHSLFAVSGLAI